MTSVVALNNGIKPGSAFRLYAFEVQCLHFLEKELEYVFFLYIHIDSKTCFNLLSQIIKFTSCISYKTV